MFHFTVGLALTSHWHELHFTLPFRSFYHIFAFTVPSLKLSSLFLRFRLKIVLMGFSSALVLRGKKILHCESSPFPSRLCEKVINNFKLIFETSWKLFWLSCRRVAESRFRTFSKCLARQEENRKNRPNISGHIEEIFPADARNYFS